MEHFPVKTGVQGEALNEDDNPEFNEEDFKERNDDEE